MPGAVNPPAVGVFGKLPARGDFVRLGLPRDFVDAWDRWLSGVMAATQEHAGEAWLPAFLQAPIWRFMLPAGLCGAGAVLGVMMPSVDRAGRYFPLTLAAVAKAPGFMLDPAADAWLDRSEDAVMAALENDAEPGDIAGMPGVPELAANDAAALLSVWWTAGSPLVPASRMTLEHLPGDALYAAMLGVGLPTEQKHEVCPTTNSLD